MNRETSAFREHWKNIVPCMKIFCPSQESRKSLEDADRIYFRVRRRYEFPELKNWWTASRGTRNWRFIYRPEFWSNRLLRRYEWLIGNPKTSKQSREKTRGQTRRKINEISLKFWIKKKENCRDKQFRDLKFRYREPLGDSRISWRYHETIIAAKSNLKTLFICARFASRIRYYN